MFGSFVLRQAKGSVRRDVLCRRCCPLPNHCTCSLPDCARRCPPRHTLCACSLSRPKRWCFLITSLHMKIACTDSGDGAKEPEIEREGARCFTHLTSPTASAQRACASDVSSSLHPRPGKRPTSAAETARVFVFHSPPSQFSFLRKGAICFVFAARAGRSYFGLHQNHAGEPSDWAGRRCAQCSSWRWATLVSVASSVL